MMVFAISYKYLQGILDSAFKNIKYQENCFYESLQIPTPTLLQGSLTHTLSHSLSSLSD